MSTGTERDNLMNADPTISIESAGRLLGVSRGTAYSLARQQRFPVPVLRVGHKLRVPLAPLLRLLGIEAEDETDAAAATGK